MAAETMLAGRLNVQSREFSVQEVAVPQAGRGYVRVKVGAAGVCLSDVHLIAGILRPAHRNAASVTLGHEVAGTVETLGAGVSGFTVGDRVVIQAGYEHNGTVLTMGVDYDGGWAEYVVIPAGVLVPLGGDMPSSRLRSRVSGCLGYRRPRCPWYPAASSGRRGPDYRRRPSS